MASSQRPDLFLDSVATPIGELLMVVDGTGALAAVEFADCRHRFARTLRGRLVPGTGPLPGRAPPAVTDAFRAYFAGKLAALDALQLNAGGTAFQNEVWTALRRIPAGTTISYGALATRIGRPKAVRAVGLANGSNPIALVVPCHRVIGADGTLTGYGGGIERKRWLLEFERIDDRT
jgi:methylated-DNA-[protein]-cysteine S-methyltransferase